jgi:tRNA(Ile)-lysidine synthase
MGLDTLLDKCGLDPQRELVAGISGGPDSLCLLEILRTAGYRIIVAHFNHKLRPEADQESAEVASLSNSLGLPFLGGTGDVRTYAAEQHLSIEEAARLLRYRFLFEAARIHSAQAVAVGHTADDQVETVLMHFLRGAGLAGLKGMEPRLILPQFDQHIPLVRPLLSLWRSETEAFCATHNLKPHYDPSNNETIYLRNRLRHNLMPGLENYNPRFKEALLRTAQSLQGDFSLVQEALDASWHKVVLETGEKWIGFDRDQLSRTSLAMRRGLVRRAALMLRPTGREIDFSASEHAAVFMGMPGSHQMDFANGLFFFIEGSRLYLAAYEADLPSSQWPQIEESKLQVNGSCELSSGWVLSVEYAAALIDENSLESDNWTVRLDADLMEAAELVIRPPHPGDRFQPLGMVTGSQKLSDFFINNKLPQRARAGWPLVCSGEQIAWIPGFLIAHPFRITGSTRRLIQLSINKPLNK